MKSTMIKSAVAMVFAAGAILKPEDRGEEQLTLL